MGKGKGMDSALWVMQGDCRDAAASLPPRPGADGSRVCGCTPSFCLPQELAEEWVVQLVAPSSCADQHAFLNEARAMLSVDFPGEVMRWNIAFGEACELLSEPQFFGTQLGNISPEFLATQLIEYRGPNRFEFV
jgi:hypothetical protein